MAPVTTTTAYAALYTDDPEPARAALAEATDVTHLAAIRAYVAHAARPPAPAGGGVRVCETRADHVRVAMGIDAILKSDARCAAPSPNGLALDPASGEPSDALLASYPRLEPPGSKYAIGWEDAMRPTPTGYLAVVNLSLGSAASYRPSAHDLIDAATRAAAERAPMVMPVGNNYRDSSGRETLSAWAEAPWVIAVGATDSADGGRVTHYSAVGDRHGGGSAPTVVAWEQAELDSDDPHWRGTSFASGRVAWSCLRLSAYVRTLAHAWERTRAPDPGLGVPLPVFGTVDHGFDRDRLTRPYFLSALPIAGIDAESLAALAAVLDERDWAADVRPTAERVRRMVIASATPLAGHEPYEAGHGFVSDEGVAAYLKRLSGADFVELFCRDTALTDADRELLARLPLSNASELDRLLVVWAAGARRWAVDRDSGDRFDFTWPQHVAAARSLP